MPLFFGIPVEFAEAMRIFGLPYNIEEDYDTHYSTSVRRLRDHLQQFDIKLFYTDKAQYIFGYKIEELGMSPENFVPYYKVIAKLQELSCKFNFAMKMSNADLSAVQLYPKESETYTVNYPEPMVIEGNGH